MKPGTLNNAREAEMDIVMTGRHLDVPAHYQIHVTDKLAHLQRYNSHLIRYDVELDHEKNPRQSNACQRVKITGTGKGPTMRVEACGPDFYTALDAAVGKLEARLRRSHDRRVHHGRHQPTSVTTATTLLTDPGAHQRTTTNPFEHPRHDYPRHDYPDDGYHWVNGRGERGSHRAGQGALRRIDDHRPGPSSRGNWPATTSTSDPPGTRR